jgi:branched-chain amino acid transport system substrate-binding protein
LFVSIINPGSIMAASEVKVGHVLPLSGMLAVIGAQIKTGAEIAAEEINAEGGIKSMGGAKIKIVFGDSKSTPDGGVAETERLITREKVSIIMGAYQSSVTFAASELAQRYKTPWVLNLAVKDEITERGFKYVFRDFNKSSMDIIEIVKALDLFAKETGKKPDSFALLYEGTDWGRSVGQFTKKYFPPAGYKLVLDESYPSDSSDFTAQILKIKAAKPDMLVIAQYTPQHIMFSKQAFEQKLYIPYGIWSLGSGSEDPAFYKAVPPEVVEYMFVQDDWDIRAPKKPWYSELNAKVEKKLGYEINAHVIVGYGIMYLVKDAIERAASADREKIRDAMAATDITAETCKNSERKSGGVTYCPALTRGISKIKFNESGENTFSHGMITQIQKGEFKVPLSPREVRPPGAKPIWPIPPYTQR